MDRILTAAFVVLVSTAIVGFSTGNTGASFTASTTNPGESWKTENVQPPASQNAPVSVPAGTVNLSWTATPTAPNGHTLTYLVLRNGVQIGTTAALTYSDSPPADGTYSYTIQTKLAQGAGFFTSPNSTAQNGISDRVAPTASMTCNGAACNSATWYSTLNVTVTGADAGSGMASGSITRSVDGGANVVSAGGSVTFAVTGDSATHNVAYSDADTAGNASGTTTFTPLKVDQTAPTPAGGVFAMTGATAGRLDVYGGSSGVDTLSGVAGYRVYYQAAAVCGAAPYASFQYFAGNPPPLPLTLTGLTSGQNYCVYGVTVDNAGNLSIPSNIAGPTAAR
jgi:hypothetical protein